MATTIYPALYSKKYSPCHRKRKIGSVNKKIKELGHKQLSKFAMRLIVTYRKGNHSKSDSVKTYCPAASQYASLEEQDGGNSKKDRTVYRSN